LLLLRFKTVERLVECRYCGTAFGLAMTSVGELMRFNDNVMYV